MTPARTDDATKLRVTLRDAALILLGCVGMAVAQVGVQWGMRSDIRDLKTAFDGYVHEQSSTNNALQTQINEWRAETKLNRERTIDQEKALSELRGFLVGSGIIKGSK